METSRRCERWVEGSVDLGELSVCDRRETAARLNGDIPARLEAGRCHRGKFSGYGKDAIEFTVGKGSGDSRARAHKNSVVGF